MPSNVIRESSYDPARHELRVAFASGRVYLYSLVPPAVAEAFGQAPSPGAFFNTRIRDRYPFRRVGPADPDGAVSLIEALRASRG